MKLYNSYCYSDINAVAQTIQSTVFTGDGSVITSTLVSGNDISINTLLLGQTTTYTVTPPDCFKLGYDNTFTGITTSDAEHYGSLVMLAFISAYVFKLIKRAL